ncbi:DNA methyltransferase [Microbacterium sp.]|uniref:Eco57I restriction-modification methylase domain-containing protein n=1 Tax=Microbacterium sp. TaxID=51671 RepID=UPI0025D3F78A|nr:DNA methyltransferase [Microbacterium sp.]MBT9605080.1 Eco57I restriction-modification methylase domain-containing protein [Microbacterium sp.]
MSAMERMKLVNAGAFQTLFLEELGWDRPHLAPLKITVDEQTHTLEQVAGYSGLRVWLCREVPDARTQRLIDQHVRKISDARLLIFADDEHQEWRWLQTADADGVGQARLALHRHFVGTTNEALNQRLGTVEIPLNENWTLIEVLRRMRAAFDADVVTRRFYDQLVRRQRALTEVIEGIADDGEREWYSALLMNRLMFIYFMQKKSFMDNDTDYLRNRLNQLRDMVGGGQFYGFYRDFLLPMFHKGLGDKHHDYPSDAIRNLVGDVPYINGGIFSEHELERDNTIEVPDEIFTTIFDLFDRFQWHLDDRPTAAQNEINPDVLGYIFEQFVNEKESLDNRGSDKGAYYTKEDVTHFMASNAMVPVFLERLIERTGVNPWRYVREAPESYIWSSLAWGTDRPLPPEIEAQRNDRNRPLWGALADETLGLPGETWWEVDRRRAEYANVLAAARAGEIDTVDRAVTENIDLEQLAIDTIDHLNAPEQALAAWQILSGLRVIDPTCGSGAFLFAGLRVLQPLYEAALDALERHVRSTDFPEGAALLAKVDDHANRDYFVLKHATLSNLYGVDIMREAVEIARLRLFLKLVATIDNRDDLEPLPDLDFNIKAGNTLVGALDEDSLEKDVTDWFLRPRVAEVKKSAARIAQAYTVFRESQETGEADPAHRRELVDLLDEVRTHVNELYHSAIQFTQSEPLPLGTWVESHHPFHWFVEFPEVFHQGGFDVVIGNPPYVNRRELSYRITGYETDNVDDIYASCCERSAQITRPNGRLSLIVPIRSQFGDRDESLRKFYERRFGAIWVSTFQERPAALFQVKVRSTIITAAGNGEVAELHTTLTHSWIEAFRPHLLATLRYSLRPSSTRTPNWMRASSDVMFELIDSLLAKGTISSTLVRVSDYSVGFKKTATYFLSTYTVSPATYDKTTHLTVPLNEGKLYVQNRKDQLAASAVAASRLAFLWWTFTGDCFNVTKSTMSQIPFSIHAFGQATFDALVELGEKIEEALPGVRSWDLNSGKYVGGYAIPELRHLMNQADEIMLGAIGRIDLLPEIQYAHARMYKSTGMSATTLRELPFEIS